MYATTLFLGFEAIQYTIRNGVISYNDQKIPIKEAHKHDLILIEPEESTWYAKNLSQMTIDNNYYRRVVKTGSYHQIVLMSIDKEIGTEIHPDTDQFFRIEQGNGKAIVDGKQYELKAESSINVSAGQSHNIINTGSGPLKLYTIYSPPHHRQGLVQPIKID